MRETGAIYGGKMSAHHHFRDFMACDSGMVPWLLIGELMGRSGRSLADLVAKARIAFPSWGEINFRAKDVGAATARVEAALRPMAVEIDRQNDLSMSFADWRLNLRSSNPEPLLRLNVETRGNSQAMAASVAGVVAALFAELDAVAGAFVTLQLHNICRWPWLASGQTLADLHAVARYALIFLAKAYVPQVDPCVVITTISSTRI